MQGRHHWLGTHDRVLGLGRYGASAPANVVFEKLGFTVENVVIKDITPLCKEREL
jgi:transketolase